MDVLVMLATGWGPKFGGVNSFNTDLAKGLGVFLKASARVLCVVPEAVTAAEVEDARHANVELVTLDSIDREALDATHAEKIAAAVRDCLGPNDSIWWIGHDLITGGAAVALPGKAGGQSAVIHHMSYIDYVPYKHGVGEKAQQKYERQKDIFCAAGRVFGVGPLLRDRLADMLHREPTSVPMLIPGLAEIKPGLSPSVFTAITFGRLDPENDRIKQGRLAVAGFAAASRKASQPGMPRSLQQVRMKVIGIATPGGDEELSLQVLVEEKAGRVLPLVSLPYDERREVVFEHLRSASVAMMVSWHEGFGLTGWEAIAAEVPLIVSKNSGLYQFIDERLLGAGRGCLQIVDVHGHMGDGHEENFAEEDVQAVCNAVLEAAAEADRRKKEARLLRTLLIQGDDACTWRNTARALLRELGIAEPLLSSPRELSARRPWPAHRLRAVSRKTRGSWCCGSRAGNPASMWLRAYSCGPKRRASPSTMRAVPYLMVSWLGPPMRPAPPWRSRSVWVQVAPGRRASCSKLARHSCNEGGMRVSWRASSESTRRRIASYWPRAREHSSRSTMRRRAAPR